MKNCLKLEHAKSAKLLIRLFNLFNELHKLYLKFSIKGYLEKITLFQTFLFWIFDFSKIL